MVRATKRGASASAASRARTTHCEPWKKDQPSGGGGLCTGISPKTIGPERPAE